METGLLRRRNVTLFVTVSLLSGFGGAAMSLAAGAWILDLTGSSGLASLAGLCVFAPTLIGPVLGAAVDRLPRRPLLIGTNLALAALLLSLLAVRGPDQVWLIFAVMLAYGVSYVLLDAGEAALLPAVLPADELGGVNGLRMSAQEGMKLLAPLIGAALYAWQGGAPIAVLSAVLLLGAAVLYALLDLTHQPEPTRQPGTARPPDHGPPAANRETRAAAPDRGVRAGIAFLRRQATMRTTVLVGATTIAMSGFTTAALYTVVTVDLGRPVAFLGLVSSAQGAGSIVGGLLVGGLLARRGPVFTGAVGALLFAAGSVLRCVPWWPMTVISGVVIGVGLPWTLVAAMTAVQTGTPPALLGRVGATANTLLFSPMAAAIPVGAATAHLGSRPALITAALICVAVAAAPLLRSRRPDAVSRGAPSQA